MADQKSRSTVKPQGVRQWAEELSRGELRSLYLLTGDEPYLIRQGLKQIKTLALAPGCESLDYLQVTEPKEVESLAEQIRTLPFMSPRRLILIRDSGWFQSATGSVEEKKKDFATLTKALHSQVTVVLWESRVDRRSKKNFELLEELGGLWVESNREEVSALLGRIQRYLSKNNIRITAQAAQSLVSRCQNDLEDLMNELAKLKAYCLQAHHLEIDEQMLDLCCREDLSATIFQLIDSVSAGQGDKALACLHRMLAQREPAIKIQFMLSRQFRHLLAARSAKSASDLASGLKIPPFVAQKLFRQASTLPQSFLEKTVERLFETEIQTKQGQIDEVLALELLIADCWKQRTVSRERV